MRQIEGLLFRSYSLGTLSLVLLAVNRDWYPQEPVELGILAEEEAEYEALIRGSC